MFNKKIRESKNETLGFFSPILWLIGAVLPLTKKALLTKVAA